MNRVTQYSEAEARDFFERLTTYSAEYVKVAISPAHRHWPSGNLYDDGWRLGIALVQCADRRRSVRCGFGPADRALGTCYSRRNGGR